MLAAEVCGKTQIARIETNRVAIVAEWNPGAGRPDMKYVERQKLNYVEYKLQGFAYCMYNTSALLISMHGLIMAMHDIVFSMNIAGGDATIM